MGTPGRGRLWVWQNKPPPGNEGEAAIRFARAAAANIANLPAKQKPMTPIGPPATKGWDARKSTYAEASRSIAAGLSGVVSSRARSLVRSLPKSGSNGKTGGLETR